MNSLLLQLKLMRFHRPVGIYLLWFPVAWALWLANAGFPGFKLFLIFFAGTVLMRAAGCIVNDMADRHIDKHIQRTSDRPLTSGQLSLTQAFMSLFLLLAAAFGLLLMLPWDCFYFALFAVIVTAIYPFSKRFFDAPQMLLGIAFSMGMPMAFIASGQPLDVALFLLMLINFLWVISYDTMYAMADRPEDLLIGVKSTAILLADHDRITIAVLQAMFHGLWLFWAWFADPGFFFYSMWAIAAVVLIYQQSLIHQRIPERCFRAFKINGCYGLLMWLALF